MCAPTHVQREQICKKFESVSIRSAYKTTLKIYVLSFAHSTSSCIYLQSIFFSLQFERYEIQKIQCNSLLCLIFSNGQTQIFHLNSEQMKHICMHLVCCSSASHVNIKHLLEKVGSLSLSAESPNNVCFVYEFPSPHKCISQSYQIRPDGLKRGRNQKIQTHGRTFQVSQTSSR